MMLNKSLVSILCQSERGEEMKQKPDCKKKSDDV